MKNTTALLGNWKELKGKLKQKYAMLTDDDMLLVEGKHDELMGRLQIKLGKSKEQHKKLSLIFLPYYYWQEQN
jgi:uncharacterized protein YjbJ (UPF0337 family)